MALNQHLRTQTRLLTQVAPARPAIAAGVRGAIATFVPIALGHAAGVPGATWIGLGGFITAVSDREGSYRERAAMMLATGVFGGLAAMIAAMAGGSDLTAFAVAALVVFLSAHVRAIGPQAGTVGTLSVVLFVVSLASPSPSLALAAERGLFVLVGALWCTLLALALWPLRAHRPAALAVSSVFTAIAAVAESISTRVDDTPWQQRFLQRCGATRERIEAARATLATIQRGRRNESSRGGALLVEVEAAEELFTSLIALGDLLDDIDDQIEATLLAGRIRWLAGELALVSVELARSVSEGKRSDELSGRLARYEEAAASLEQLPADGPLSARVAQLRSIVRLFALFLVAADETLRGERPVAPGGSVVAPASPGVWSRLVENLSFESVVFRHALRLTAAVLIALLAGAALHVPRGYWVTLTVIVILQPYTDATVLKALQRVSGTVTGCIVAALIGAVMHDPKAILVVVFVLAGVSLALFPINYVLYLTFLTPTFVLLAEVNAGDWHLVNVRIANTLLGGAIALAAATFFWPRSEASSLRTELANALDSVGDYLSSVIDALLARERDSIVERSRRREAGLRIIAAETSLERLFSEKGSSSDDVQPLMTLTLYVRRLATSSTAMRALPVDASEAAEIRRFRGEACAAIGDLAAAIREQRGPAKRLTTESRDVSPVVAQQLDRITRQIEVLHRAASRLHPAGSGLESALRD